MVTRKVLSLDLVVRIYRPQPFRIDLLICFAVKGGGEVKKKQRCLLKRFAALVAAMILCVCLCVPAFASNNASTKKWVVVEEDQMRGENGVLTKYFKLSPYQNGAFYQTDFRTRFAFVSRPLTSTRYDVWARPENYPDWWRSDIPLGNTSYIEFSNVSVIQNTYSGSSPSDLQFIPIHRDYLLNFSNSYSSSAVALSGQFQLVPLHCWEKNPNGVSDIASGLSNTGFGFSVSDISSSNFYIRGNLVYKTNISYIPLSLTYGGGMSDTMSFGTVYPFSNASSSDIIWVVAPKFLEVSSPASSSSVIDVRAVLSYWVDANKLPAGLQVGDEFPADTDAFDKLRDDLINQFPEASENIENGKATIQGWNDTETVDTDVASTSISALNAMFQNLGGFLFIVSLMSFGAVVLRMLIRKAVEG